MSTEADQISEMLKEIRPLIGLITDRREAEYLARNLEQQVKILTLKYRTGNALSNMISKNSLPSTVKRI